MARGKAIQYLTTQEAAAYLERSPGRIRQLICQNRLKTTRFGNAHMINPKDLDRMTIQPVGYPKGKKRKILKRLDRYS